MAAGAVVLPRRISHELAAAVRDSKQLSASQRDSAYELITDQATAYAVGWTTPAEIDRVGIAPSVRRAMHRALVRLDPLADALLIDAISLHSTNLPQKSIIRGDSKSLSIAAASIVAKVERDRLMIEYARSYPTYGFDSHKGYGTERHMDAIRRYGPCALHRMSFRPMSHTRTRNVLTDTTTVGAGAESFVASALEDRGMRVVDRNFRTRFGEVDLVALKGDTVVFIEVRARRSTAFATQAESISESKVGRLIAACQEFLQRTKIDWSDWRIDVAAVDLDDWRRPAAVEFIESAIEE